MPSKNTGEKVESVNQSGEVTENRLPALLQRDLGYVAPRSKPLPGGSLRVKPDKFDTATFSPCFFLARGKCYGFAKQIHP